jgi:hypothetical protein
MNDVTIGNTLAVLLDLMTTGELPLVIIGAPTFSITTGKNVVEKMID